MIWSLGVLVATGWPAPGTRRKSSGKGWRHRPLADPPGAAAAAACLLSVTSPVLRSMDDVTVVPAGCLRANRYTCEHLAAIPCKKLARAQTWMHQRVQECALTKMWLTLKVSEQAPRAGLPCGACLHLCSPKTSLHSPYFTIAASPDSRHVPLESSTATMTSVSMSGNQLCNSTTDPSSAVLMVTDLR